MHIRLYDHKIPGYGDDFSCVQPYFPIFSHVSHFRQANETLSHKDSEALVQQWAQESNVDYDSPLPRLPRLPRREAVEVITGGIHRIPMKVRGTY